MSTKPNRNARWNVRTRTDDGLGKMFLVSLGVHLAFLILFMGPLLPRFSRPRPPVYYVDLVHIPVSSPQSGRPDAPPAAVPPKAEEKIVEPPPPPAPVKKAVLPSAPPKKVATTKKEPAPSPKTSPTDSYAEMQKTLQEMQDKLKREREMEALKKKLAALATDGTTTPVGSPQGRGTDVGVEQKEYIRAYIQENWSFSRYQISDAKAETIEAVVSMSYDTSGALEKYNFETPSGDRNFDDSLKTAILKSKQLPKPLGRPLDVTVTFNLKEMINTENRR